MISEEEAAERLRIVAEAEAIFVCGLKEVIGTHYVDQEGLKWVLSRMVEGWDTLDDIRKV